MVVGMQHQQQQPHASPATVLEDATTPCVGSPPLNTPSTVDSVSDDVSDGSESSTTSIGAAPESSMAVAAPALVNSSLYSNNRVKLREVNPHLVCVLCQGYFVDATSIAECLHSFCRSCIILHLGRESCCPICKVQINNSKPHLSLKPDKTLQDIVYKLVPGLFHAEMKRRNEFYQSHPDRDLHLHPEFRGITVDRLVYSPQDSICLSLEYYDKSKEKEEWETVGSHHVDHNKSKINLDDHNAMPKKYFVCPAAVRVMYLKKIIRLKYNLEEEHKVELFYRRESLPDEYSLMDIAYIYAWKRNSPMRLYYKINILATVAELTDKVAIDMVDKNSSQLSPASEQERAVIRNNSADEDNDDQIDADAVKRPITPLSPNINGFKSNEDAKETREKPVIHNGDVQVTEKDVPSNKAISTISHSSTPIAKISKSATSTSSTPTTTTKSATAKTKSASCNKKETGKSKLKPPSTPNLKPLSSEAKSQTPIKSYLSISSILSDIDKPEVSKKPVVKNPRKSSDSESITPSVQETSVAKPLPVSQTLVSAPTSPVATTTTSTKASSNKDSTPITESNSLKITNGEPAASQSIVKTETTPTTTNSGRKTPILTPITTSGRKTPVSTMITNSGRETPVMTSSMSAESHNTGCKTLTTTAPSIPNACGKKTPTGTPVTARHIGIRVPIGAKSLSRNYQVPKAPVSTQNSDIQTSTGGSPSLSSSVSNSGTKTTLVTSSSMSNTTRTSVAVPLPPKVPALLSPMKQTPIFCSKVLAAPKPPPTLLPASCKVTISASKANPAEAIVSMASPAKANQANSIVSTASPAKTNQANSIVSTASPAKTNQANSIVSTASPAKANQANSIVSTASPAKADQANSIVSTASSVKANPENSIVSTAPQAKANPASSVVSTPSQAKANAPNSIVSTASQAKANSAISIISAVSQSKSNAANLIVSTASPAKSCPVNSIGSTTSLAKTLSIPSSTSITVSSKSLPPPLISLTSTPTMSTFVTSKDLAASQYIPPNTKIPSSLEISLKSSKEVTKLSVANTLPKMVPPLTNGTPKSHFIGKKAALEDVSKTAVKRAFNGDKKSTGEPEKKISKPGNEKNGPPKKIFSHNILPEVSITLNSHPEQNKRISPETSYDVSCFKPNDVANGIPPLTPINSPICKNIQNSPIKNLNNKKLNNAVRIVRNSSLINSSNKLKHSISNIEKTNGETESKKARLENGSQQNGFHESTNGKEKSTSSAESTVATSKPNEAKTPSPTSTKKEARHLGIPNLIDIKAAAYSKLITQDAKARLQFLKNTLYVNPSTEPATNSDNALDLSSPSSKSPSSDKSDPSPEKKKLIPKVPPHMIPVTMVKNDKKAKTSPTNTLAKMDKSPARKADFKSDNGSPSTPTSRPSHSPIFSKTPSPVAGLHCSPSDYALNQVLAFNFLQRQQQNQELLWLMHACQNGQLPSHPLMHKSTKSPTSTSESAFQIKK